MLSRLYTIMGATGQTGHILTQELLRRGHKVRALGRDTKKLSILKTQGAEIIPFEDYTDEEALRLAFLQADAIFTLIPPDESVDDYAAFQEKVGKTIKSAVKKAKVRHIVNLSSIGAELPDGAGPITGLHKVETALSSLSGVSVLNLRAGFFMENLQNYFLDTIKKSGILGSPYNGDLAFAMVSTRDIGKIAAEFLDQLNFKGQSHFDFVGPKDVTFNEVPKILGKALDKPDIKNVQVSYEDAEKGMIASGMKPRRAAMMIEMARAFNEGRIKPTQPLTLEHRGKTTIDEYAKDFAKAYKH